MTDIEAPTRREATASDPRVANTGPETPAAQQARRSRPYAAKLLLPVWGYNYVRQFLEIGLPTLLAPGNVPAVARSLLAEFIILTSADDEAFIREHPGFKRLAAVCPTTISTIDHLITDGNYSTTITLAYTEAVRNVGAAMVDTCFFFLVSDYIVADGSLENALKRILRGASAVVVGNFQVALEQAQPWLQDRLTTARDFLALPPRELMRWSLNHLHPATLANTVNIPFSHNSHTNRLFWRVDGSTVLGRFYLMHMLCVRPEVMDFVIGSSCDYSFIPEMCPSGNVEAIGDSDEYLVVELQPVEHESAFLRPGPLDPRALAKSLNDWATSVHRANAHHSVVFHADDLPPQLGAKIAEADQYVAGIERYLKRKPLPHRGHPYWRGAMAAFYDATGRKLTEDEWRYALGFPPTNDWLTRWLLYRAKYALMGQPPRVLPWHPDWPDLKTVLGELAPFFADRNQRLLMLSNEPTAFTVALADNGERVHRMRCVPFLKTLPERYLPLHGKFDICLLELPETDLRYGDELIDRIVPLMKNGGRIIVSVRNRRISDPTGEFGRSMAYQSARLIRSGAVPAEVHFVPASGMRQLVRRRMASLRLQMNKGPWIGVPAAILGGLLLGLSFIGNLDALRPTHRVGIRRRMSSFVMRLSVDGTSDLLAEQAPVRRARQIERATAPANKLADISGGAEGTREPQYNRCIELRDTIGLASLGLMTNQVWYDDPRRLTFLLARYKFVAKILGSCRNVGEIGCGDAFGTRIVRQEVADVTVYDFDPLFIEDIRSRQDERWAVKAEIHDIVASTLPRKHEALFSLDVLEHIAPEHEHEFLSHICDSLTPDGLLMIGTPSLQSQPYASPQSKAGHINCKTGDELKALLEKYFKHVFIFSMNDEVVHTGFSGMAHYLFALCAQPRVESGELKRSVSPLFEICEVRTAPGFYVRVTHPNSEPQRVDGFATVGEAASWISDQTQDWIRAGRQRSY
jgi:hypothetical protein